MRELPRWSRECCPFRYLSYPRSREVGPAEALCRAERSAGRLGVLPLGGKCEAVYHRLALREPNGTGLATWVDDGGRRDTEPVGAVYESVGAVGHGEQAGNAVAVRRPAATRPKTVPSMTVSESESQPGAPASAQPGPEEEPHRPRGLRSRFKSASTARAAPTPHIPCTPPPGGVEAEQRYSPRVPVLYGFHRIVGRKIVWRSVPAPPLMSPPT